MLKITETKIKTVVEYKVYWNGHTIENQFFSIYKVKLSSPHKELTKLCKEKGVKIARSKHGSITENIKQIDKYVQEIHVPYMKEWLDEINELDFINNDDVNKEELDKLIEVGSKYGRVGSNKYSLNTYIASLYNRYEDMLEHINNNDTVRMISLNASYQELMRYVNKCN